ncbi:hypothetical protein BDV95DRAFT_606759 [Massariosphaeria phaeospora]|uniref:HMG box domain-containing protein n=1 Tax=Massariosphaeria phaeospora TaxID=100035 RepID=A0A7C8MPV5_9PLEO|nr:hypothetical protein BDV95DRAFT_606759 [Massariosphaeria phaeospora]
MAPTTAKAATPRAKANGAGAGAGAGVKKAAGKSKGVRKTNARNAMVKMQAYFKENRSKYKHLDFKEQQKELGKQWKTSSENPKNNA